MAPYWKFSIPQALGVSGTAERSLDCTALTQIHPLGCSHVLDFSGEFGQAEKTPILGNAPYFGAGKMLLNVLPVWNWDCSEDRLKHSCSFGECARLHFSTGKLPLLSLGVWRKEKMEWKAFAISSKHGREVLGLQRTLIPAMPWCWTRWGCDKYRKYILHASPFKIGFTL